MNVDHVVSAMLTRGREVSVRCLCGWESHWWPSYTKARQQLEMHKELHTDA